METTNMSKALKEYKEEEANDNEILQSFVGKDIADIDPKVLLDLGRRRIKREILMWGWGVSSEFANTHYEHRLGHEEDYGMYRLRITNRVYVPYVEWHSIVGKKYKGKVFPRMKSIPMEPHKEDGKERIRMPLKKFPGAKEWELEAISKAEDELMKIRRCIIGLKKMQSGMASVYRLLDIRGKIDKVDPDENEHPSEREYYDLRDLDVPVEEES